MWNFFRRFVQCIKTIPRTTTFPRSSSSHINNLQGIASFVLCNCHHRCHHSPLFHTSDEIQKALRFHHTPNMPYRSQSHALWLSFDLCLRHKMLSMISENMKHRAKNEDSRANEETQLHHKYFVWNKTTLEIVLNAFSNILLFIAECCLYGAHIWLKIYRNMGTGNTITNIVHTYTTIRFGAKAGERTNN